MKPMHLLLALAAAFALFATGCMPAPYGSQYSESYSSGYDPDEGGGYGSSTYYRYSPTYVYPTPYYNQGNYPPPHQRYYPHQEEPRVVPSQRGYSDDGPRHSSPPPSYRQSEPPQRSAPPPPPSRSRPSDSDSPPRASSRPSDGPPDSGPPQRRGGSGMHD